MIFSSNFFIFIGILLCSRAYGLYSSPSSGVIDLNPSNFQSQVINSDEVWVVEFYAPWCGHCQQLVPDYQKAAQALKGVVKVGGVNADEHKSLAGQYQVKGFPTIKLFGLDKKKPQDYQGDRSAKGLVDGALRMVKEKVMTQLSGKKSFGGGDGSSGSGGSDVVELSDSNFDKLVLNSNDVWMVEFFAPWCGHCKNLAPHWEEAATAMKGVVKFGALDATVHTVKASTYGVQGYPTIKVFSKGDVEDYNGGRTASDIIQFASNKAAINIEPPDVLQITSKMILTEACQEHPLCVIAVLPHILDCQSKCRNDYIQMLIKLGDKYKQKQWGWVWTEAMAYPSLEESLEIGGFGYPALAALNAKKMQFALLRGSFGYDGINEFLRDISFGRGRTAPVRGAKFPNIKAIEPWDGKDGTLPEEEDYDDVELEDSPKDEL